MKILLLSRYTRLGASSRLRTAQYLPFLADAGFDVEIASFFDDAYLHSLYSGRKQRGTVISHTLRRVRDMRKRPRPDVIWLEKEALPWMPWLIEHALWPRGVPTVSDYDDAIFHRYDQDGRALVRTLLGQKIGGVMAASAMVMAGNPYLAAYARQAGAKQIEVVPTVVDLDAYTTAALPVPGAEPCVGWIGTPQTWSTLAHPIHAQIDPTLLRLGARFRAVGAGLETQVHGTLEIMPWSEATEVALIQSMDIGLMPLPDTPWTRGKCGYKLIQYMACGVPVIASPVGVNRDIVEHGVNGFLAETDADWRAAIETLLGDAELRRRMGAAGRKKVEDQYSLQTWGPRVAEMLRSVVSARSN